VLDLLHSPQEPRSLFAFGIAADHTHDRVLSQSVIGASTLFPHASGWYSLDVRKGCTSGDLVKPFMECTDLYRKQVLLSECKANVCDHRSKYDGSLAKNAHLSAKEKPRRSWAQLVLT
jgi:hypothetical protein